jgi:hypothetical protein
MLQIFKSRNICCERRYWRLRSFAAIIHNFLKAGISLRAPFRVPCSIRPDRKDGILSSDPHIIYIFLSLHRTLCFLVIVCVVFLLLCFIIIFFFIFILLFFLFCFYLLLFFSSVSYLSILSSLHSILGSFHSILFSIHSIFFSFVSIHFSLSFPSFLFSLH